MNPMNEAWSLLKGVKEMQFRQPKPTKDPITGEMRQTELPPSIPPVLQQGRRVGSSMDTVGYGAYGVPHYRQRAFLDERATEKHPRTDEATGLRSPASNPQVKAPHHGFGHEVEVPDLGALATQRLQGADMDEQAVMDIGQDVRAVARPSVGQVDDFSRQMAGGVGAQTSGFQTKDYGRFRNRQGQVNVPPQGSVFELDPRLSGKRFR